MLRCFHELHLVGFSLDRAFNLPFSDGRAKARAMADHALRRILLEPDGAGGAALFSSQLEIARAVAALEDGKHYKERALSSFLGQIFNGARSCPRPLASLIARAAAEAADVVRGAAGAQEVEARIRAALALQDGASEVDNLLAKQISAELVVIVRSESQEVRRHPRMADFQQAMCRSLRAKTGRYVFAMADNNEDAIAAHWRETLDAFQTCLLQDPPDIESDNDLDFAKTELQKLDDEDRIVVLAIPAHSCVIPVVAFDPHTFGGWCEVYIWDSYMTEGRPVDQILKLNDEIRIMWAKEFYRSYLREHFNNCRRKFSDIASNSALP